MKGGVSEVHRSEPHTLGIILYDTQVEHDTT